MSSSPDPTRPYPANVWNRTAARLVREALEDIMSFADTTPTPPPRLFKDRVEDVKTPKSDINAFILDYLTTEGYPNAAAKFRKEANLQSHPADDSMKFRQQIRNSIHTGSIQSAVETLNDFDPEILDRDPTLHFSILRLQLVELIRTCMASPGGDISPALEFATTHLGPRAPTDPRFLKDLEETMALLILPHHDLEPQLAAILHPDLRCEVADNVNRAILERHAERRDAAIRKLVKMRAWAETSVRSDRKALSETLPERITLNLNETEDGQDSRDPDHDPMLIL